MATRYAVFGPGYGRDHLDGEPERAGDLHYEGTDLGTAKRELAWVHGDWVQAKEDDPGLRNTTWTYSIYQLIRGGGWQAMGISLEECVRSRRAWLVERAEESTTTQPTKKGQPGRGR